MDPQHEPDVAAPLAEPLTEPLAEPPAAPANRRSHPGRPRSASADQSIIEAAADMLAGIGYQAMTMEAVAVRAGVSKATLYRRYGDKEALVIATIMATTGPPPRDLSVPGGSARESLTRLVKTAAMAISSSSWLPILGAMFSEGPHERGLSSVMHSQIFDPSRELVGQIVRAGVAQGEIRSTLSAEVVNDVLFGALLSRSMAGAPIDDRWIDEVITSVWEGFGAAPER